MLKLIVGLKGHGKTKQLIELVNRAVKTSPGNVACIEKGDKLKFDLNHAVRLVDTEEYGVYGVDALYGLICGILAANYDIKDLFIDSSLKICDNDVKAFEEFVFKLEKLLAQHEISCVTTVSAAPEELPSTLDKFIY